jgi:cyclic pyranopterin phosphate synthase
MQEEKTFSHLNQAGEAQMVDVSAKVPTKRTAIAKGKIYMVPEVIRQIKLQQVKKGDVLSTARIAGIMGLKKTADLIPLCHPLAISHCAIDFEINEEQHYLEATCTASLTGKTGVEMEALTGVNIALLTIYDMCKAIDKKMHLEDLHLVYKSGGKSGEFTND